MSLANADFDARIARITSGKASSKSTLYVGLDEIYHVSYSGRGKPSSAATAVNNFLFPFYVMIAMGFGIVAFGIASWVRFRFVGLSAGSGDPMTEMAIQAGAALAAAIVLNIVLPFRSRPLKVAMAIGAISTTVFFHNAVHLYPETFARVFSPDWVEVIQATTKPQSVLWQGRSYTF